MNPTANTYYAITPEGYSYIWGTINGQTGWIRVYPVGAPNSAAFAGPELTYQNLNDGSWINMVPTPASALRFSLVSTNFDDIGPAARRVVAGAPAQAQPAGGGLAPMPTGGYYAPQSGGGLGGSFPPAIAQLLTSQQANTATATILAQANTSAQAAAAFGDFGPPAGYLAQGIALSLGASSSSGIAQANSSMAAVLVSLLGSQALPSLATATTTFNSSIAAAAALTDVADALNAYQTALKSILSTVQNNQLLGAVASGQAQASNAAIFAVLLAQNAVTAFNSATPTVGPLLADIKTGFSNLISAWNSLASSLATNAIIMGLL